MMSAIFLGSFYLPSDVMITQLTMFSILFGTPLPPLMRASLMVVPSSLPYLLVLPYPIWHLPAALPPPRPVVLLGRRPAGAVLRRPAPVPAIGGTTAPSEGGNVETSYVGTVQWQCLSHVQ